MATTQQRRGELTGTSQRNSSELAADPAGGTDRGAGYINVASILTRARSGDARFIGQLLQHYRNYLMLIANAQIEPRIQHRVSPSDVVQETMLKAHRHFANFRGNSERELLAWLRQILVNNLATFVEQHMMAAKRDVRREISIQQIGTALDKSTIQLTSLLGAHCDTPSIAVEQREEAVILANRMAQLPEQYRTVLLMRNIQSLPFDQVAERMGRSLGATRMLWLRAIDKLRAIYRKEDWNVKKRVESD